MTKQQSSIFATNEEEFLQSCSLHYIPCVMGSLSKSGDDDNDEQLVENENHKKTTITLEGIVYDSSSNHKNNMMKNNAPPHENDNNDTKGEQQRSQTISSSNDERIMTPITTTKNNPKQQPWFVSSLFSSIRNSFGNNTNTTVTPTAVTTNTHRRRRRSTRIDDPYQQHTMALPLDNKTDDSEERDKKVQMRKNFVQHDDEDEENDGIDGSILDRRCDDARVASRFIADQSRWISRSFEDTTFLLEDGLGCGTRMLSSYSFDMADLTRSTNQPTSWPRPRRHVSESEVPSITITTTGASSSQSNDCLTSSITFPLPPTKNKTTFDGMNANTSSNNNHVIGILAPCDTLQQQQHQQKLDNRVSTLNTRSTTSHDDDYDKIVSFEHKISCTSPSTTKYINTSINNNIDINMGNTCMVCPPNDNDGDNDDDEDHYQYRQGSKLLHQQVTVVPLNDTFDKGKQRSFGRINSHGTFEETVSPSDSLTSLFLEKQKQQQKETNTTSTTTNDASLSTSFVKDVVVAPKEEQLQNNSSAKSTNNTIISSDNKEQVKIVEVPTTKAASPPRSMIRKFVRKMSSLSLPSLAVTATTTKLTTDSKHHHHRRHVMTESERLRQLKISRVKHLLRAYGCTTPEEHVDKVDELLALCKDKKGWEGLTVLGFGYRMIHPPNHCTCHVGEQERSEDSHLMPFLNMYAEHCRNLAAAADAAAGNDTTMSTTPTTEEGDDDEDSSLSSQDDDEDNKVARNADDPTSTSSTGAEIFETIKSIHIASHAALNYDADNHLPSLSAPSSAGPGSVNGLSSVGLDYLGGTGTGTVTPGSLSGFSFGTNRTEFELKERLDQMVEDLAVVNPPSSSASSSTTTNATSSKDKDDVQVVVKNSAIYNQEKPHNTCAPRQSQSQQHCLTRLVYLPTNTIITVDNRHDYIADGTMYEEIARLTQEASQECMMAAGNLQWVTICDDSTQGEPIRALVDVFKNDVSEADSPPATNQSKQKTLLIVTGKGKVRAGIFSRKHLLTTGMEPSTALPLVYEARQRHLRVVILDPNARGDRFGMQTFEQSLNHLFQECHISSSNLYVLAHSAAGAQLVRFLNDKQVVTTSSSSENDGQVNHEHDTHDQIQQSSTIGIDAIAFTDSTHNVQWTKHNPALHQALVDETTSIYLKSAHQYSEEHEYCSLEMAGQDVLDIDEHWKHRFGTIPTKWAGTQLHELTNWTGRHCIWEHFDQKLNNNKEDNNKNIIMDNDDDDATHNM